MVINIDPISASIGESIYRHMRALKYAADRDGRQVAAWEITPSGWLSLRAYLDGPGANTFQQTEILGIPIYISLSALSVAPMYSTSEAPRLHEERLARCRLAWGPNES